MNRKAGFEKHLDERMESLGYSQSEYELGSKSGRVTMKMTKETGAAALRDVASRLQPDFNAVAQAGMLVFMPVRQQSTVGDRRSWGDVVSSELDSVLALVTAADGIDKGVSEMASALDEVNEAILEAEKKVKEAEGIARKMGGEVSRVVGGQLELYLERTLKAFRNNEHQPGSVSSLMGFLDGWYQEQKARESEEA